MPHTANIAALREENGSPTQSKQAFATSLTPSRNAFPPHLCTAMCTTMCTAVGTAMGTAMCKAMCTAVLLWGVFPGQLHLYCAPFVRLHTRTGSVCPCFIHPFQYSYRVKAFQKPDLTFFELPPPSAALILGGT